MARVFQRNPPISTSAAREFDAGEPDFPLSRSGAIDTGILVIRSLANGMASRRPRQESTAAYQVEYGLSIPIPITREPHRRAHVGSSPW